MKNTIVISAFSGVGKTTFFNSYKDFYEISDSDSSTFDKSYFPQNYIEHIKSNIGKVDFILVSTHENVRKSLEVEGIKFILLHPLPAQKHDWIERLRDRGDSEKYINLISENWLDWVRSCTNQSGCIKIPVSSGRYLSDFISLPV